MKAEGRVTMTQETLIDLKQRLVETGKAALQELPGKLQTQVEKGKETLAQVQEALVAKFDHIVDRDTFKM